MFLEYEGGDYRDLFKSYGEPKLIDLTSVEAISLGGPSGVGKSGMIEALTFALSGSKQEQKAC